MSATLLMLGFAVACGSHSQSTGNGPLPPDSVTARGHDWPTFDFDPGRSGVSTAPTGITASNVGSLHRQQVRLPGTVDASVIYLSDVQINGVARDAFFLTTTYGKTLAIDANSGATLWTFTPSGYSTWVGSSQITNVTPVADPGRQYIYAASPDGNVEKLGVADGHAIWTTAVTLAPSSEKIASSLNYFAGRVVVVTGGYVGDAPPYQGHVAILDASSGAVTHVWNSLCSTQTSLQQPAQCSQSGSAIWGRSGAVIDTTTGDIYVATGNGLWDGVANWGDATVQLDSTATHILANYTPTTTQTLEQQDLDVGSTSPVLLGNGYVAQGGKDGNIRVLNVAALAGPTPHEGGEAQTVRTPSGLQLFTAPAILIMSGGTWLFAADNGVTAAWTVSGGKLSPAWRTGHAGTSPVVAGGLLFVYDPGGGLRVYQAMNGNFVASLPCGGGHWNSPIVADGRIVLPEGSANAHSTTGVLDIWRVN